MKETTLSTILNEFKKDKLILEDLLPTDNKNVVDVQDVIELLEGAYNLEYDEDNDELIYIDSKGNKIIAPDLAAGVTTSSEWLCNKLPEPILDFEQGGSLQKIEESRSVYTLTCLGIIFSEFTEEIKDKFQQYDFEKFEFKISETEYKSLTDYLQTYLDINSLRINVVVSSANIRISQTIEKKDVYWKSLLTHEEITEYARISRSVKNVILKYEREHKLNPSEIGSLTKVDKLKTIDNRDKEIDLIIDNSNISILYRIVKLNSERLGPTVKRKIFSFSRKFANSKIKEGDFKGRQADECYEQNFREMSKKLTRYCVITLRVKEIKKFRVEQNNYKLRKKM